MSLFINIKKSSKWNMCLYVYIRVNPCHRDGLHMSTIKKATGSIRTIIGIKFPLYDYISNSQNKINGYLIIIS